MKTEKRKSGILLPVFSLPSEYGMGCLSADAREFIDRLHDARQSCWQILPVGPTGHHHSPYQPLSCFAGDPMYIDPDTLYSKGLLTARDLKELRTAAEESRVFSERHDRIDYRSITKPRIRILKRAFSAFSADDRFDSFCKANASWLDDYAMFHALSDSFGTADWSEWPSSAGYRDPEGMKAYRSELGRDILFHKWTQFEFFEEWNHLRTYAHSRDIEIFGDMPFYASYESSDCWSGREMFLLGRDGKPKEVAGCPPDDFSSRGQIWNNPLYDWSGAWQKCLEWWLSRISFGFRMYDVIRIDHIRGFEAYFSIPAGSDDAAAGSWKKGPGIRFFDEVKEHLGERRFIAEDLGFITPAVEMMVKKAAIPRMKVLQFAFDSGPSNPYLPEHLTHDSVIYTGTHDNDTTRGWWNSLDDSKKARVSEYIGPVSDSSEATRSMISLAYASRSSTCIIPMQDHLLLDSSARINMPGRAAGNWNWEMRRGDFTRELSRGIADLTIRYNR